MFTILEDYQYLQDRLELGCPEPVIFNQVTEAFWMSLTKGLVCQTIEAEMTTTYNPAMPGSFETVTTGSEMTGPEYMG